MNVTLLQFFRGSGDGHPLSNLISANTGPRWVSSALRRPLIVLSLLSFLLCLPVVSWAQAIDLITYQNTAANYDFTSRPNSPSLVGSGSPQNGIVEWVSNGDFSYTLTYTPNENFIGIDHFTIRRWEASPAPHYTYLDVDVIVSPALIEAYHDYAVANANETINVDVLANDISSNGVKILQAVPAVNHGSATFDPITGLISFTPKPGFRGTAHFNYALCNGAGDCDDGTVSITVMGENPSTENETIKVFTKKNETQFILVPETYTLIEGPSNGVFDPGADVPEYTPETEFTGSDLIRFTDGSHEVIFDIEVLNLAENTFALNDQAFTTTNSEIDIDVQDNDLSTGSGCFSVLTQPENGSATHTGNGVVVYTPNAGFVGVDQFTYRSFIGSCAGEAEIATVTVFVSNFAPDRTTFEMATPKNTPIIIGYNVPSTTFSFEVSSQGELGETIFLEGEVDTVINGLPIQGNNILIYIPYENVIEGLDEVEITYCLTDPESPNDCLVSKQVKIIMTILDIGDGDEPVCVGDCVWAGDTNADGIVNMNDLLPIGQSMGEIGGERIGATFDVWYGQYAEDWSNLFGGNEVVNVKHIDADGNSIVTASDTVAIRSFYGRTHNMVPSVMPYAPYEFIINGPLFVNPGDYVEFTINIGTPADPAEDVYGFVFPLAYNPEAVDPESISIRWDNDNFLSYDSPVIYMDNNDGNGLFEAGYTRTSGLVASGHGQVAKFGIVIDDLVGFRNDEDEIVLPFGGNAGASLNKFGNYSAVAVRPFNLRVRLNSPDEENEEVSLEEQLKTYPNPTANYLTVHLNGQQEFEQVVLRTLTGQVLQMQNNLGVNETTLNLSNLPNGIYILSVTCDKGTINRKIEVVH